MSDYTITLTHDECEELKYLCMEKAFKHLSLFKSLVEIGFKDDYDKQEYEFFNSLYEKFSV